MEKLFKALQDEILNGDIEKNVDTLILVKHILKNYNPKEYLNESELKQTINNIMNNFYTIEN